MKNSEPFPDEFELITTQLKKELRVKTDADLAHLLRLHPQAFYERKKRNSFPIKSLLTLIDQQPALNLDYEYIVKGARKDTSEIDHSHLDEAMIQLRQLNTDQQATIMRMINLFYSAHKEIEYYENLEK